MGFGEIILRMLGAIAALVVVLFLAWYILRWVNKRVPGAGSGSGRMMNVLERISVGKNSTLMLVRVKDKVFLVAVSDHAIQKITEFDDPDETMKLPEPKDALSFSETLKQAASKIRGPKDDDKPGGAL